MIETIFQLQGQTVETIKTTWDRRTILWHNLRGVLECQTIEMKWNKH